MGNNGSFQQQQPNSHRENFQQQQMLKQKNSIGQQKLGKSQKLSLNAANANSGGSNSKGTAGMQGAGLNSSRVNPQSQQPLLHGNGQILNSHISQVHQHYATQNPNNNDAAVINSSLSPRRNNRSSKFDYIKQDDV